MEFETYFCDSCKRSSRVLKDDPIPRCCGKLMTRVSGVKDGDNAKSGEAKTGE